VKTPPQKEEFKSAEEEKRAMIQDELLVGVSRRGIDWIHVCVSFKCIPKS